MANKQSGLVMGLALLLSACGGNLPMRFYMLEAPLTQASQPGVLDKNTVIGLGPIHLPEYLDRPQMVVAIGDNQYQFDEKNRWAERLDQNLSRVLAQQLAADLGVEQVVRHPWAPRQTIDYQITLDVLTFHQTASGDNRLSAQWQVKQQEQTVLT
ncbi:MAG: membrane integrity-associated transporter subunit PqiC, partial [Methylomonas sp.]